MVVVFQAKNRRRLNKKMIRHVRFNGDKIKGDGLSVYTAKPLFSGDNSRVGFIIRKKTGHAVFRNRLRRILRKSFQDAVPGFSENKWVLFDIPPCPLSFSLKNFKRALHSVLGNIKK